MASICDDPGGRKRIAIVAPDGSHKSIRLGQMPKKQAENIRQRIEDLLRSRMNNTPPGEDTVAWLTDIDRKLRKRLAAVGLVDAVKAMNVGALVDDWLERRKETLQPQTVVRLQQGKRSLIGFFGENRPIGTITEGDAEDYRAALLTQKLAEATTRKRCSDARVWFRYAMRHGLIRSNPFECVATAAIATGKLTYISEADGKAVIGQLADPDLRLLFALARWGGLRIVSEPKAMTWDCIDWAKNRITVKSPKTARHPGHEQRIIPMFPELVEHLQAAFDRAEPGEIYVLPMLHQKSSAALRDPIFAAIKRAGLTKWPRLWHNLRSSRQTDLEAKFPSHVVCAWLGNSTSIARRHYLQILDRDFEKAIGKSGVENGVADSAFDRRPSHEGPADTPVADPRGGVPLLASHRSDPDGI